MARTQGRRVEIQRRRAGGRLPSLVASALGSPVLVRLPPREQEIAALVYLNTDMTAKELEQALSHEITNSAIRCMLGRLVAKGVLRRRKGQGKTFIYSPAALVPDVQERALERVIEDYFGGSLSQASQGLVWLISRRDPEALAVLSRCVQAAASSAMPAAARLAAAG